MTYTFLEEEIEAYILFTTVPVYVTILVLLQSKNLKILERLTSKRYTPDQKNSFIGELRKLKKQTPFLMFIGLIIHLLISAIYLEPSIRPAYYVSMLIIYIAFTLIAYLNFYMKGAGVLKDLQNYNGFPPYL